jgi:hypothetical protein
MTKVEYSKIQMGLQRVLETYGPEAMKGLVVVGPSEESAVIETSGVKIRYKVGQVERPMLIGYIEVGMAKIFMEGYDE